MEGSNQKLYGRALLNNTSLVFNRLAILAYVRDFDSENSGRDAHSLEVLEALRFPEIKFYSESFEHLKDSLLIKHAMAMNDITRTDTLKKSYSNCDERVRVY